MSLKSVTEEEIKILCDEIYKETEKPVMRLILTDEKPGLTDSKFGGTPYLPYEMEVPRDAKGNQLRLLAQIDCTKLKDLEDFPHIGLLQFWVEQDDACGCHWDSIYSGSKNDGGYKIIYHETIDNTITEEDVFSRVEKILEDEEEDFFPVEKEYGLLFSLEKEGMTFSDYRYEKTFLEKYNKIFSKKIEDFCDLDNNIFDIIIDNDIRENNHKINGYPEFAQNDPREHAENLRRYDILLLQIDSDLYNNEWRILWGDAGTCNFFINREDLKKCNFDDVLYNWDCC